LGRRCIAAYPCQSKTSCFQSIGYIQAIPKSNLLSQFRIVAIRCFRIGLIGDFDPSVAAHRAIPSVLAAAGAKLDCAVESEWLPTTLLAEVPASSLARFDGLWCVPASPYRSMSGALQGIRYAREKSVPFLGTCGGFQHAIIEYARSVMGYSAADHAESNPQSEELLITPLTCSLVGQTGSIRLLSGSRVASIYGCEQATERYHCNFGVNPEWQDRIGRTTLKISGLDEEGSARVIELADHPFFMGTLFQPELNPVQPHPIILAFARAVAGSRK
jgi:CTP synthase (UTP-ammonia lyase)